MTIIAKIGEVKAIRHCECKKTPRLELRCTVTGDKWRRTIGGGPALMSLHAAPFLREHGENAPWLEAWLKENLSMQMPTSDRLPIYSPTAYMTAHKQDNGSFTLTVHGRYREFDYWGAVPLPGRYDTEEEATEAGQIMLAREAVLEAAEAKRGNPEY